MKKQILLFALILFNSLSLFAQYKDFGICYEIQKGQSEPNGLYAENDTIAAEFDPSPYSWRIVINNKLTKSISIDWGKAIFVINDKSSQIIFKNTLAININNQLGKELIASKTKLTKDIVPKSKVYDGVIYDIIKKSYLKKSDYTFRIILPITIDNMEKEFEFNFIASICKKQHK